MQAGNRHIDRETSRAIGLDNNDRCQAALPKVKLGDLYPVDPTVRSYHIWVPLVMSACAALLNKTIRHFEPCCNRICRSTCMLCARKYALVWLAMFPGVTFDNSKGSCLKNVKYPVFIHKSHCEIRVVPGIACPLSYAQNTHPPMDKLQRTQ